LKFIGGDLTCGGLIEESWVKQYDTAEECCLFEYNWIENGLCAARSTRDPDHSKYWADKSGKCYLDSAVPTEDLSVQLYDTIEDCCAFGVSWLSERACLAASGEAVASLGSSSFYVKDDKCVKDCEGAAPCGGLAEKWNSKFNTEDACCASIPWIPRGDCVLA
jgi:hypothetical protein